MTERDGGRPKPRIQPKMNTDTRRHGEKSAYSRRPKYRDDPLDSIEPELDEDTPPEDDGSASGEGLTAEQQDEGEDDAIDPGEPGTK